MSSDVDTQKGNLRPFTRRGSATANGNIGGTTLVSLWDPAVPEGLNEADDYWNDGQIFIHNGAMADQAREITGFVQATGVITVAPRFVNPVASLLTVNAPAGDQVIDVADASGFTAGSLLTADAILGALTIDVVDASIFRVGNAVIWDTSPAAEMVVITNVNTLLNQLTIVAPGITWGAGYLVADGAAISMQSNAYIWDNAGAEAVTITGVDLVANQVTIAAPGIIAAGGYTVAANAAISMSPTILEGVGFTLMPPTKTVDTGEHTNPESLVSIEQRLGRNLNDFFVGTGEEVANVYNKIDINDYWTADGFRCPGTYIETAMYTRRTFDYPLFEIRTLLPSLPLVAGFSFYAGIQVGDGEHTPLAALFMGGAAAWFSVYAEGNAGVTITALLPVTYATAEHRYAIKMNKCNVELYIDGVLVAIVLLGVSEGLPQWVNVSPYALRGATAGSFGSSLPGFITIKNNTGLEQTLEIPSDKESFNIHKGDPLPPRQYALYTDSTATKWNGLTPGGVVTSHPVPVWGYPNKTLYFQSDAAGSLDIEVYVGGAWRVYETIVLAAGILEIYPMAGEAAIARCVYTPTNQDTINVAEWYLS